MDSIQSLGSSTPDLTSVSRAKPGSYEANSKEYGPVIATVMSAGHAVADAASATYTFSKDALNTLEKDGEEAWSAVKEGAEDVASTVEGAWDGAKQWVENGVSSLEDDAAAVGHDIASAARSVGEGIGEAYDATTGALGTVASYVGTGVSLAGQAISELV